MTDSMEHEHEHQLVVIDDDADSLVELVRAAEEAADGEGWDSRPSFHYLLQDEHGLFAHPIEMPGLVYQNPGEHLGQFARLVLNSELARALISVKLPPSFYGVMITHECWGLSMPAAGVSIDEARARFENMPRPSQSPDRIEMRMCTALTTDGRIVHAARSRGEEAACAEIDGVATLDAPNGYLEGRLVDGLRLLCAALEQFVDASS